MDSPEGNPVAASSSPSSSDSPPVQVSAGFVLWFYIPWLSFGLIVCWTTSLMFPNSVLVLGRVYKLFFFFFFCKKFRKIKPIKFSFFLCSSSFSFFGPPAAGLGVVAREFDCPLEFFLMEEFVRGQQWCWIPEILNNQTLYLLFLWELIMIIFKGLKLFSTRTWRFIYLFIFLVL